MEVNSTNSMSYKSFDVEIDFSEANETLADVFGDKPVTPPQMIKLLWKYIKENKLNKKPVMQ